MVTPVTGKRRLQIQVFPERILNIETAQALLDELNKISGITRIVVYGPRLPKDDPQDLLEGKFKVRDNKFLNIMGEKVELTVQVGRVFIELEDPSVKEAVREACEKALPFSFEIDEGLYIKTQKTITDYVRKGGNVDDISIGMFDPKEKQPNRRSCCTPKMDESED